jgi:hypothetical protein
MMTVFFAWSRETRAGSGLGWLEVARRANFATLVGSHQDTPEPVREDVDDDEALAAYNAYLARINKPPDP